MSWCQDPFRLLIENVAVALAFFIAGQLGVLLDLPETLGSPFWPPSGIALAAFAIRGARVLPGIAIAVAAVDLVNFAPVPSLGVALDMLGAIAEPATALSVARRLAKTDDVFSFRATRDLVALLAGIMAGGAVAVGLGLSGFLLDGTVAPGDLATSAPTWWIGNVTGALVFAPFLLTWLRDPWPENLGRRPLEATLLLAVLPLLSGVAFGADVVASHELVAVLEPLAVPVVLAASYRFGIHGTVTAVTVATASALAVGMIALKGDVASIDATGLSRLQVFIAVVAMTGYLLASEIASRRKTRCQLLEALERAEEANSAKTLFLAKMSHELRTPLNAILGFSEVIAKKALGDGRESMDRYVGYAGDIHASGSHLLALINDVLDVSRMDSRHYTLVEETVDVACLVAECAAMLRERAAREDVAIEVEPVPAVCLRADRRALRQLLLNLLTNAVKFSHRGGTVTVAVTTTEDGGLTVSVADHGIGIADDTMRHLFEPFRQGPSDTRPSSREGAGLGLSICKGIADLHGGTIMARSGPGEGTTMSVAMPPDRVMATAPLT